MIDVNRDRLLSLAEAARRIPGRSGRPISKQTVWKWTRTGLRGVKLEAEFIGGDLKTSEEAIARFISAMNTKRGRVVQRKAKASTADALKREFGIELTERQHGGATQGADADSLPVGQMAQRPAVASA